MIGVAIGVGAGLAINYALGRSIAQFTWENYRADWWRTFSLVAIPMGVAYGLFGFAIESLLALRP